MTTIPTLGGALPLLGHALSFRRDPIAMLNRGLASLGPVFRFQLLGQRVVALLGPAGNEAFFRASDDQLCSRQAYRFTIPIFGKGVAYDVAPELMDEQLRLLHPGLREEAMQRYAGYMQEEVSHFMRSLGDSGEIDLLARLNELTIFIAGRCLLGATFRQRLSAHFAELYNDLEGGINLVAFLAPHAPTPANRRRDRARRGIAAIVRELIAQRRQRSGEGDDDFLGVLMKARMADGSALDDEIITGLLITLLFAGQHTSAVMATWLGVLLLQHPDELEAVRGETTSVLAEGPLTLAGLKSMVRTEAALKEAERLYPPLVMLMRTVLRDFEVGGACVPAGSLVLISPACTHRMPALFAKPDRFDPTRFLVPRREDRANAYALIGFGGGKHRCLGLAFAHQQIKTIWSLLLRDFEMTLVDGAAKPDYTTFVVGPIAPCRVRYRRRAPQRGAEA